MKASTLMLGGFMLVGASALPLSAAANDALCADKAADVNAQLEHARAQNDVHRVEGLERALHAIEHDCTNESVLDDAREEVQESLQDVQERQADFEQALDEGDDGDIQKRREKLEEATRELEEDTAALNALESRLGE
ncbi:DUF1090 domain-containing protein [Halomonas sp. HNIBRBA4712]|uniref:DUF1090 domain-containing protein n=1 Tax=Halomonas sp. HNIBRBA4712 TaxID=3373087 RepID=UPI0037472227